MISSITLRFPWDILAYNAQLNINWNRIINYQRSFTICIIHYTWNTLYTVYRYLATLSIIKVYSISFREISKRKLYQLFILHDSSRPDFVNKQYSVSIRVWHQHHRMKFEQVLICLKTTINYSSHKNDGWDKITNFLFASNWMSAHDNTQPPEQRAIKFSTLDCRT